VVPRAEYNTLECPATEIRKSIFPRVNTAAIATIAAAAGRHTIYGALILCQVLTINFHTNWYQSGLWQKADGYSTVFR
jgi:hypothetical protein